MSKSKKSTIWQIINTVLDTTSDALAAGSKSNKSGKVADKKRKDCNACK